MTEFSQFHDGWFEGLLIEEKQLYVFLATHEKERFVLVAKETEALAINGVKAGNIIFDVVKRGYEQVQPEDIDSLYEFPPTAAGKLDRESVISKMHREKWSLLEINPSYGASCLILADSFCLLAYAEWLERRVAHP